MSFAPLKRRSLSFALAAVCLSARASNSWAVVVPFFEDFDNNNAGWANFNSSGFATYDATGGADGGAYISGPRTLNGLTPGNATIALRARHDDPWNSSSDAFVGNWRDMGARQITAWMRHDIPTAVSFFVRAANPANFPGHIYVDGVASDPNTWKTVQPNIWTEVAFDLSKFSNQLLSPEGGTWDGVFSNVGHVQFGVIVPNDFSSDTTAYTIILDKVGLWAPEPTSAFLAVAGLLGVAANVRRRKGVRAAK